MAEKKVIVLLDTATEGETGADNAVYRSSQATAVRGQIQIALGASDVIELQGRIFETSEDGSISLGWQLIKEYSASIIEEVTLPGNFRAVRTTDGGVDSVVVVEIFT